MDGKADQIERLVSLETIRRKGSNVQIVADEWCNTLQDIKDLPSKAGHMIQIKTQTWEELITL